MEHRWFTRVDAPIIATLHTREDVSLRGLIHNISYAGILFEIEGQNDIEKYAGIGKNKVVSVQFKEDGFAATLLAQIVRHSGKTAALMFIAHNHALRPFVNRLRAPSAVGRKIACS